MPKRLLSGIVAGLALIAAVAACSDQPSAPKAGAPSAKVTIDKITDFETYQVVDFTVDQKGGTFNVGPHYVKFPSNSICDPAVSTYGPTEWDKPCQVIKAPITFRAEIQKNARTGEPAIRFTPDVRFAPDARNRQSRFVYLYMVTEEAKNATTPEAVEALLKKSTILWSPVEGLPGIDESILDPSVATYVLPEYSIVYRRVKHFSGYQVGSGRFGTCEYDGTCEY